MKSPIRLISMAALLALSLALPSTAGAEQPPPLPQATNGATVKRFATGVGIPTQIAFSGRNAFISGAAEGPFKGGVFVVRPGAKKAAKVPGTPKSAFGIVARSGKVFVSAGRKLIVYSRFDGKREGLRRPGPLGCRPQGQPLRRRPDRNDLQGEEVTPKTTIGGDQQKRKPIAPNRPRQKTSSARELGRTPDRAPPNHQ